jgi:hypothetical protein
MKCFYIVVIALLAATSMRAQQGTVTFGNNAGTPIAGFGTNISVTVALYGSTALGLNSDSTLAQIGAVVNTFSPGLFSGGTRFIGNPGDVVTLQVRAWTGGFASWDLASAAALATPNVHLSTTRPMWEQPVGGGTLPTQPITGPGRFQGLNFEIIPEPSTVAMALFGVLAFALGFPRGRRPHQRHRQPRRWHKLLSIAIPGGCNSNFQIQTYRTSQAPRHDPDRSNPRRARALDV